MAFKDIWQSLVGYKGARGHFKDTQRQKGCQFYSEVFFCVPFLQTSGWFRWFGWGEHLALVQAHNIHTAGGIIIADNNNRFIQDIQTEGKVMKYITTKVKVF